MYFNLKTNILEYINWDINLAHRRIMTRYSSYIEPVFI